MSSYTKYVDAHVEPTRQAFRPKWHPPLDIFVGRHESSGSSSIRYCLLFLESMSLWHGDSAEERYNNAKILRKHTRAGRDYISHATAINNA